MKLFVETSASMKKTKFIAIIIILSALLYANSLNGDFVSDDIGSIRDNPSIDKFSGLNLSAIFNWVGYKISGLNPFAHHLSNLILHAACSVLVFYILLGFFSLWPSFLATLLFVAHPVHTETIAWISGKAYAFSALLIFASFLLYRRATSQDKLKPYAYLFSIILCNPFHAYWYLGVYPAMIILYDFTYRRVKKNWPYWIPYIGLVTVWVIKRIMAITQRIDVLSSPTIIGTNNLIYKLAFSFFSHLKLLLWPGRLTLYHEPTTITQELLLVEIIAIGAIICFLPFLFKRAKELFFALGIYVLFLAPTYSPILISWTIAERYLYVPSVGFFIFIAFIIENYYRRPKAKIIIAILMVLTIGTYSIRTIIRNNDWSSRANLWRATVRVSPLSAKAHNNMGDIYTVEGDLVRAADAFKYAIKLNPNYAEAYHNLGTTYGKLNQIKLAAKFYKKALSLAPSLYQSHQNLGAIYFNRGDFGLAKKHLSQALKFLPQDSPNRAVILNALERIP